MGIFTGSTRAGLGTGVDYAETIPATEGYGCVLGAAQAMLEVQQNDMAIFEAAITSDFNEVAAVNEGYEVVNEGAKDILNKIIEMFKKLLGKIKGIFEAFLAKLSGAFKSNKKLYDQYKKKITESKGWKDFKVKCRVPIKSGIKASVDDAFTYDLTKGTYTTSATDGKAFGLEFTKLVKADGYDTEDIKKAIISNRLDKFTKKTSIDGDMKNMETEFMDALFKDEEIKDDWNLSEITGDWCGSILSEGNKWEDSVKKTNKKLTDAISKIINELEKIRSEASKKYLDKATTMNTSSVSAKSDGSGGWDISSAEDTVSVGSGANKANTTTNIEDYSKKINALQRIATNEQEVITKFTSTYMNVVKFTVAQARKVWTSAAAYVSTHNEGAEFYQAVGESYEYNFLSDMEAV